MIEWLLVPVAYLIGSVSSAIIVCRLIGVDDPREKGSGNPGADKRDEDRRKKGSSYHFGG